MWFEKQECHWQENMEYKIPTISSRVKIKNKFNLQTHTDTIWLPYTFGFATRLKIKKQIIHFRQVLKQQYQLVYQNSHPNTYLFSFYICWDSTYQHNNSYPSKTKQHSQHDSQSKIHVSINNLRIYRICLSMVMYTTRCLTLTGKKNKHKLLYFINAVRLYLIGYIVLWDNCRNCS